MKKFLTVILAFLLILTLGITAFAETPDLPSGNKLLEEKWSKLLGDVVVTESTVDGKKVHTATGFNNTFHTPSINIYPSIKALMGNEEEVTVWIVFDVKHQGDEVDIKAGLKLRAIGLGDNLKTEDDFLNTYDEADTFTFNSGNVYSTIAGKGELVITNEWTRFEISKTFSSFDINDNFWKSWHLCFDYVSDFNSVDGIQIRNTGIFLEDDYQPVNVEDEDEDEDEVNDEVNDEGTTDTEEEPEVPVITPTPVVIQTPNVDATPNNTPAGNQQTPEAGQNNSNNNGTTIILISAIAVVVAAAAVVTIIVIKKKKNVNKED